MTERARPTTIKSLSGLEAIVEPWRDLFQDAAGLRALQAPDFLLAWWRFMGDDRQLFVPICWEQGALCGLLPLQISRRRISGKTYRVLEFMGMPNELCLPQPLVANNDRTTLYQLLQEIARARRDWDILQLDELASDHWCIPVVREWATSHNLLFENRTLHDCAYLTNCGGLEAFRRSRSKRFSKRMRALEKGLSVHGHLEIRNFASAQCNIVEGLEQFFAVESKSWKNSKGLAVGAEQAYRQFLKSLASDPNTPFDWQAFVLTIDDRPVAATFGFSADKIYYGLQIAHDREFDQHSPGTLLEWHELSWFLGHSSLKRYEFLGGDIASKRRWTELNVATVRIAAVVPGWHWRLRTQYKHRWVPALKGWSALRRGDG